MAEQRPASPRGRAVVGLTWAIRGLLGFLGVALLTAIALVGLVLLYGLPSPTGAQTAGLQDALLTLSWILLVLGAGSGLIYAVGLAGLYGTHTELGREHAESVPQALPWLAVTMVLLATGVLVPSLTGPFLAVPGVGPALPDWADTLSVVLAGMRAIFAGLTLYYAVQGLAEESARVRLLVAMSLGVVGAIAWSGLASLAEGNGTLTLDSLLLYLAGIVAGLGTTAISLGLFVLIYREIRGGLRREASAAG